MEKRVLALGFFDGVHLGHGALLKMALHRARELSVKASAVSFDIPPVKTENGEPIKLINSSVDRADIMRRLYGIDDLIFLHFDDSLRTMEWDRFIYYLKDELNAVHLIAGYDFRFGYMGKGNARLLSHKCRELGLGCDIIDRVTLNGETISSTAIRKLLAEGNIEKANELLGHKYFLTDTVKSGYKLGRKIGTPTINMAYEPEVMPPKYGVYATKSYVLDCGEVYESVTNVGVKPTVTGDNKVTVESFLLGFSGNLYGKTIRVEFYKFIRPEQKFSDVSSLTAQIQSDINSVRLYFSSLHEDSD